MRGLFPAVGIFCLLPLGAAAVDDDLASKFRLLDERGAGTQSGAQAALPASVRAVTGYPVLRYEGAYKGPYLKAARAAATRHGLPADMFARLIHRESAWNPRAVSPKGAIGLGQLMPATARGLGVDPWSPDQNLEGAARYLRAQYDTFGSWRLALAAYNAGPEAVRRHGGVPPYSETRAYVIAILGK